MDLPPIGGGGGVGGGGAGKRGIRDTPAPVMLQEPPSSCLDINGLPGYRFSILVQPVTGEPL